MNVSVDAIRIEDQPRRDGARDLRMSRWLAGLAFVYTTLVVLASWHPKSWAWGVHLPAFLPPGLRSAVLALLAAGGLVVAAALRQGGARVGSDRTSGVTPDQCGPRGWWESAWLPLPAYAAVLWLFRTRTHFLGDGMVWLAGLRVGELPAFSEPVSRTLWMLFARLLHALHTPASPDSLALLPVGCGVLAALIAWNFASEWSASHGARSLATALVLTLGASQLYFGYIESYPPCSVAVLAYLWLGLRCARRGSGLPVVAVALAVSVACHLATSYLIPSFIYLIWRVERSPYRRLGVGALFVALAMGLLLVAGSRPHDWLEAIRAAAPRGLTTAGGDATSGGAGPLSPARAVTLLNEVLLVAPVPLLLLIAAVAARRWDATWRPSIPISFLILASAAGLLTAVVVWLPLPPAQDWDLMSLLVFPVAILGLQVGLGRGVGSGVSASARVGLVLLSLGSLSAFVLVNANTTASTVRFKSILADASPFGRGYGYGMLAEYYRNRGDLDSALVYADRSLAAQPANARYWAQMGALLNDAHLYRQAVPYLARAARLAPERAAVRNNLGIAYTGAGRFADALVEFREAVRLEPDTPDYRQSLALSLINCGEPDSAKVVLMELLARWPDYLPARLAVLRHFPPR